MYILIHMQPQNATVYLKLSSLLQESYVINKTYRSKFQVELIKLCQK